MFVAAPLVVLLLAVAPFRAAADDKLWRTSWDAALYGYAGHMALRADSVLNPENRIARLPQRSDTAELRFNLRADSETVRLTARGLVAVSESRNAFGGMSQKEGRLGQWQARVRTGEAWSIAAGRDVLNWGPAQFRSPSSPFYFDNGRSDPMRELTGMDMVQLSWTPDMGHGASLTHIMRAGDEQAQSTVWRDSWLLKLDRRGDDWAYGLAAAHAPHLPTFFGAHGQWTPDDTTLLYGEYAFAAVHDVLRSPEDTALPFSVQPVAPRRGTVLLGMAYTFEDGRTLSAEYLHDGHGYTPDQTAAYFARAASSPVLAGQALGLMPRLLGRDYLHLVWQSNLMESDGYWRLMATHNLTDGSGSLGGYAEHHLDTQLSAFVLVICNAGGARGEAAALYTRSLTLGLKLALP